MAIYTIQQRLLHDQEASQALTKAGQNSRGKFNFAKKRRVIEEDFVDLQSPTVVLDDDAQRNPFDKSRVKKLKKIIDDPDAIKFGRLTIGVIEGDERLYIADGQGRAIASYCLGQYKVPADFCYFGSFDEMKNYFKTQHKNKKNLAGWELHHVIKTQPTDQWYGLAQNIEHVRIATGFDYDPTKAKQTKFDCSKAYQAIRKGITTLEEGVTPDDRSCKAMIAIINFVKSDLWDPRPEPVLSLKKSLLDALVLFVKKAKIGQGQMARVELLKKQVHKLLANHNVKNQSALSLILFPDGQSGTDKATLIKAVRILTKA